MAPPLILIFDISHLELLMTYSACAAKASFNSITSISLISICAFSRALFVAGIGPVPILLQSTPAIDRPFIFALKLIPFSFANCSLDNRIAAAPIDTGLEVAAVMVPFSRNAGSRLFILSRSGGRGPSSFDTKFSP